MHARAGRLGWLGIVGTLGWIGCSGGSRDQSSAGELRQPLNGVPNFDHVLVVIDENHSYSSVVGSSSAPYINGTLIAGGALFTNSVALTHPSQPNYLHLFSGSSQGVSDDTCPPPGAPYTTANLGFNLLAVGRTFAGYSEDQPSAGSTSCGVNGYARKHNP